MIMHLSFSGESAGNLGYKVLPTVEKTLVCGDKGFGAMAEVDTIVNEVKTQLGVYQLRNTDL